MKNLPEHWSYVYASELNLRLPGSLSVFPGWGKRNTIYTVFIILILTAREPRTPWRVSLSFQKSLPKLGVPGTGGHRGVQLGGNKSSICSVVYIFNSRRAMILLETWNFLLQCVSQQGPFKYPLTSPVTISDYQVGLGPPSASLHE